MINSKEIGNIGEAATLFRLVELGIPVYQQFGDNEVADYIILVNSAPKKIQVKTSNTYDGEKTLFDLTSSTFHRKHGVKHKYTKEEVDAFICYDLQTKNTFLVKNDTLRTGILIRYVMPKNNQLKGVNFYKDYLLNEEKLFEI